MTNNAYFPLRKSMKFFFFKKCQAVTYAYFSYVFFKTEFSLPGYQPEMPDSTNHLLKDPMDLEFLLGFH